MRASALMLVLLFALCLSLATLIDPRMPSPGGRTTSSGLLETLMGDSRRLFATHFMLKADAYFHSGYYPAIFDNAKSFEESHLVEGTAGADDHASPAPAPDAQEKHDPADGGDHSGHDHAEHDHSGHDHAGHDHAEHKEADAGFLGAPRDWIDRFSRHFYPTTHTHLDQESTGPGEKGIGEAAKEATGVREMLPWLRLSAELDPNRIEVYAVTAYWLRSRMNQPKEAEAFLREGLRANPGHPALLFELGRLHEDARKDPQSARNVWELALEKWRQLEGNKKEPDQFLLSQIAAHLAKLEEKEGQLDRALTYWDLVKRVSPHPEQVEKRMAEVKARQAETKAEPKP